MASASPSTPTRAPRKELGLQSRETDFYSKWLLLHALGPFLGPHERQFIADADQEDPTKLRRSFLNAISYLCDIERGGKTVTAAALQRLPLSNFLWLAANENVRKEVFDFVENILFNELSNVSAENRADVEKSILHSAVKLARQRMESYRLQVRNLCQKCCPLLQEDKDDESGIRYLSPMVTARE